jgi:hypothetical protein
MLRKTAQLLACFALLPLGILHAQYPQDSPPAQTATAATAKKKPASKKMTPASKKMTDAQKIALAMSAGPAEIARNATIIDMTDMAAGQPKQLRGGSNGWACYASMDEPMCLDKEWQKWAEAWMKKTEPKIEGTGFAYMLRGDKGASNTDPFATAPTADNQWVVSPPHLMVLLQDPKLLDAYPTDPKTGGPWVMWKGTPYAHIMVPVSATQAATMPSK